jgi:hypothetical protein
MPKVVMDPQCIGFPMPVGAESLGKAWSTGRGFVATPNESE